MRAAVALRNVVGEALHRFRIRVVPLHRDLDDDAVFFTDRVEDPRMQDRLAAVHEFDEGLDASGIREVLARAIALIGELDLDAVVQERQLADALRQNLGVKFDAAECGRRSHEVNFGSAPVRRARHGKRRDRNAIMEVHLIHPAAAPDPELEPLGQAVYHGDTDAVQAAGDLVRILVELAPGMELGHHDLGRRALELVVVLDVGRNAAAVVDD